MSKTCRKLEISIWIHKHKNLKHIWNVTLNWKSLQKSGTKCQWCFILSTTTDFPRDIVCIFLFYHLVIVQIRAKSHLRSLRQVATLRHGHMARRSASLRSCIWETTFLMTNSSHRIDHTFTSKITEEPLEYDLNIVSRYFVYQHSVARNIERNFHFRNFRIFHRWSIGGPPVATGGKASTLANFPPPMAIGGPPMATDGFPWVVSTGSILPQVIAIFFES